MLESGRAARRLVLQHRDAAARVPVDHLRRHQADLTAFPHTVFCRWSRPQASQPEAFFVRLNTYALVHHAG